jgi:transcriptional regulator with XRE-family HTH domain
MTFQELHESLRQELSRRIESGTLTGTALARQVGFQQAHISNFLNRKRWLSLEGLDRVLEAQNLSVDQLMPLELNAAASNGNSGEQTEAIPVVTPSAAMDDPVMRAGSVIETIHVPAFRLRDNRSRPATRYSHWQRFVAVRADQQQAAAMEPMLTAGSVVVLDRHYNSLAPYRGQQRTLYAVRHGSGLMLRFVEYDDDRLLLRPLSLDFPVALVPLRPKESPGDYIVGRVCLVFSEL